MYATPRPAPGNNCTLPNATMELAAGGRYTCGYGDSKPSRIPSVGTRGTCASAPGTTKQATDCHSDDPGWTKAVVKRIWPVPPSAQEKGGRTRTRARLVLRAARGSVAFERHR